MDYKQLREEKEAIKIDASTERYSWRQALEEEHPYVEVCPEQNPKKEEEKKENKKAKSTEKAKEIVKEERAKTKEEAAARLAANKKAIESGKDHESPYSRKRPPVKNRGPVFPKDPWSAHADDVRAHSRGMQKGGEVTEERKDEKGMTADQKSIGRSIKAGMNPLTDPMAGATRQRLSLATRGLKKKRGVKEEIEQVEEMVSPATPEEKAIADKAHARHEAQYARGAKEHRAAKKAEGKKPLRKGEVRWQDKKTGEWKSNKDS